MKGSPSTDFMLQDGDTWACLGNSITEDPLGYVTVCADMIRERYPDRSIRIVNAGVSGNKAADMLARLERDVLHQKPDWVSISVGVNDVWHGFYDFERDEPRSAYDPDFGQPYDRYLADLSAMVSKLLEEKIQVILIAPTLIGSDRNSRENVMVDRYAKGMREVAKHNGVLYCPMHEHLRMLIDICEKHGDSITTDGVHMNGIGAQAMACGVLNSLGFYLGSGQ